MSDTSNTTNGTNSYRSYLLRLWCAPGNAAQVWRASLEEPLTQQVHRFEDLQSLFNFLLAQPGHGTQGATTGLRTED